VIIDIIRSLDSWVPSQGSAPLKSLNYSVLKKASQKREIPVLDEEDLEETFVKGRILALPEVACQLIL
jgi:hypothetical protein